MTRIGLIVGGWFAGAVIGTFVSKARSILEDRGELHGDVESMLLNVEASLLHIQAAVDVAERRPTTNHRFTNWLQMIKEIASEAENMMDDFEIKRFQKSLQNQVSGVLVYLMENLFVDDDIKKLKSLLGRLEKIASQVGSFSDLLKLNDSEELVGSLQRIQPIVYGRDKEKEHMMNIIFPDVPQIEHFATSRIQEEIRGTTSVRVVCIVGKAGVGKTTLAQVIYNHPNVKEAFDLRGWAFLCDNFDTDDTDSRDIYKNIAFSFAEHQPFDPEMNLEPLQAGSYSSENCLSSIIENKRFLLVLDNAQDNMPHLLKILCCGGATGSIIVVTTRSEDTATRLEGIDHVNNRVTLDALSPETVSAILKHHAFGTNRNVCLDSIGEKIAGKLQGLPLLAEAIGRLLRLKLHATHWQKVHDSEWWDSYEDLADTNPTLPSVTIIFEFLSDGLKKCLAYSSMFPSGYLFERRKLVHMWMSNYVQQHPEFVYESTENQWIDELLNRSLIQSTVWANKYTVHQAIKEFVTSITGTGCYTVEKMVRPKKNLHPFSHLAIEQGNFNASLDLRKYGNLRSVLFFGGHKTTKLNEALTSILPNSSAIRVLDLSCIATKMEKLPDVINTCSHLRYLDLSFTGITMLPNSFCGLYHLQVLGLRGCQFKELPRGMNNLVNLRYLYAEACTVSLIHRIGQLTNLQGLDEFAACEIEGHMITELKDLNELGGHLCICNLEKVTSAEQMKDVKLSKKIYIQKLVLKWHLHSKSHDYIQTLAFLKPNENLEELEIYCYMGALLPSWIVEEAGKQYFTTLQRIKLSGCKNLAFLPQLGKLKKLKILILQGLDQIKGIGDSFYGNGDIVFPSLEVLKFSDMTNWESWLDMNASQTIPKLRKILIKNCRKLEEIPGSILKGKVNELELSYCSKIFERNPTFLEKLENLKCLRVYQCMGTTIYIPEHLLASLDVLRIQNCQVCFQGGQHHVARFMRSLTINSIEVRGKKRKTSDTENVQY